jgi:hypothetical protein
LLSLLLKTSSSQRRSMLIQMLFTFLLVFALNASLLSQYSKFVKPAFEDFILPTKKYADIIIPRGGDNDVAIDLIVQHIRTKLGQHDLCKIHPNLYVIQSTYQVSYVNIHTHTSHSLSHSSLSSLVV